jgi:hypothetical protein
VCFEKPDNSNYKCECYENYIQQCYSEQCHSKSTDKLKCGESCPYFGWSNCRGAWCKKCYSSLVGTKCQNEGVCRNGQCVCPKKFFGEFCENKCVQGTVNHTSKHCECFKNYGGPTCEQCKCKNSGTCTDSGGCTCPKNYQGILCENPKCKNAGILDTESHQCKCPENFEGKFCEICKCQNGGKCVNEVCTYPDTSCKDSKCKDSGNTEHTTQETTSVHSDEAEGNNKAFEISKTTFFKLLNG